MREGWSACTNMHDVEVWCLSAWRVSAMLVLPLAKLGNTLRTMSWRCLLSSKMVGDVVRLKHAQSFADNPKRETPIPIPGGPFPSAASTLLPSTSSHTVAHHPQGSPNCILALILITITPRMATRTVAQRTVRKKAVLRLRKHVPWLTP